MELRRTRDGLRLWYLHAIPAWEQYGTAEDGKKTIHICLELSRYAIVFDFIGIIYRLSTSLIWPFATEGFELDFQETQGFVIMGMGYPINK